MAELQADGTRLADEAPNATHGHHHRLCPACGKPRVYRSRRRTLPDQFLALVGLKPYRCHECRHRFHAWRRTERPKRSPWAQCPRCQTTALKRIARDKVPRTWSNMVWRYSPASAYRCPDCRRRFYDFRSLDPSATK